MHADQSALLCCKSLPGRKGLSYLRDAEKDSEPQRPRRPPRRNVLLCPSHGRPPASIIARMLWENALTDRALLMTHHGAFPQHPGNDAAARSAGPREGQRSTFRRLQAQPACNFFDVLAVQIRNSLGVLCVSAVSLLFGCGYAAPCSSAFIRGPTIVNSLSGGRDEVAE